MKRIHILLAIVAAAGLALGGYYLGQQRQEASAMAAKEKPVLYWHDPMVPGHRFDKPGKSPFMDMQLVPVYAGERDGGSTVAISSRMQQNLGMRIALVTLGRLASALSLVGSVAYDERDIALVQARANGFVERLHVRSLLEPVRKGQVLAELHVPDWVAAQEEYLAATRMQGAADIVSGARQRMRLAGMSDEQIAKVASAGKVQARVAVLAPLNGVVSELSVREGMTLMAGAPLFRINGLARVWVNAEVPEGVAAQVRPGMTVEASTPSLPGRVFKGKVSALLPEVTAATRTLKARIELANLDGRLAPGMFATISLAAAGGKDVLLVPSEAVIQTGTRSVVMVAEGEGKFMPADVVTGAEAGGQVEILRGLKAGQQVVVSGQFLIDSEASLKGTGVNP